jgi:tripartite-type tricarboxylate transporter receptor subunit TctC
MATASVPPAAQRCAVPTPNSRLCTMIVPKHAGGTVDVTATVEKVKGAVSKPADQFTYN